MSTSYTHDELVQQLQSGQIDFLQFVMNGENNAEYLKWCGDHRIDPSNDSAEFFLDWTENEMMDNMEMYDPDYGHWF